MIEICFSDSEKGCLKVAGFTNVISLYGLDMFDITNIRGNTRKQQILESFLQEKQEGLLFYNEFIKNIDMFELAIKKCEDLRIWYSDIPYSIAGMHFAVAQLINTCNSIITVKLPKSTGYLSWAEVYPSQLKRFLKYEREFTFEESKSIAKKWQNLIIENTFLRSLINGVLTSVDMNYYDKYIYNELTSEPITEGYLIGTVLGKYRLGISDTLIANRIEYLIFTGELNILEDNKVIYKRVLKKGLI